MKVLEQVTPADLDNTRDVTRECEFTQQNSRVRVQHAGQTIAIVTLTCDQTYNLVVEDCGNRTIIKVLRNG